MATRTKKTQRTQRKSKSRRGGNDATQFIRRQGLDFFGMLGPSTSALAKEIYPMFQNSDNKDDIKSSRISHFNDLIRANRGVNRRSLIRDLEKMGMTSLQRENLVRRLH
jgi:hypothetical protein